MWKRCSILDSSWTHLVSRLHWNVHLSRSFSPWLEIEFLQVAALLQWICLGDLFHDIALRVFNIVRTATDDHREGCFHELIELSCWWNSMDFNLSLISNNQKSFKPRVNFCGPRVLSYQNESPFLILTYWSPIRHVNKGPITPPFTGYSARAPV